MCRNRPCSYVFIFTQVRMDKTVRKVRNQDSNPCIEVSSVHAATPACRLPRCLRLKCKADVCVIVGSQTSSLSGKWRLPEVFECLQLRLQHVLRLLPQIQELPEILGECLSPESKTANRDKWGLKSLTYSCSWAKRCLREAHAALYHNKPG